MMMSLSSVSTTFWEKLAVIAGADDANSEKNRKRIILTLFLMIGISVCFPFGIHHLIQGNILRSILILSVGTFQLVSIISLHYLKRAETIFRLNVMLLGIYFLYLVALGGVQGSRILWVLIFPLFAFYQLGKKEGLLFCIVHCLVIAIIFIDAGGLLGTFPYDPAVKTRFIIVYSIIVVMSYFVESTRQRYQEGIERINEELEIRVLERTIELDKANETLIQEIKEGKKKEKEIRESETRLLNILEASPIGVGISRIEDGKIQFANKRMAEIYRKPIDQVIGVSALDGWIDIKQRHQFLEIFNKNGSVPTTEIQLKRLDGSLYWGLLTWERIRYLGENHILFWIYDIDRIKLAEQALLEANTIINRSPAVAFLWKNLEGWPVEFVSDNVEDVFGYTASEFMSGQVNYKEIIHADDLERVANEVALFLKEKRKTGFLHQPYRIVSKDGQVKWLDDRTYIRRDKKGDISHYEGIVLDITDHIQAAEALEENEKKLVRFKKMESLGLLAGGVAHDLNNVLSGIVSYPELILMELPDDSPIRKPIETIKDSGDRAAAIVQDLLTVARGVATAKEPLNLNDLIEDYLNSPEFGELKRRYARVTVKTGYDSDLLNIRGSAVHIRKVVMNLIVNAAEAITAGGNISISTANRYLDKPIKGYDNINVGEYAVLAVADDGSGIPANDLERIFEPFYTKKVMGRSGTGLGLAVIWNVIQDHDGYIDITSNQKGTTFELFFPITREAIVKKDLSTPFENLKGNGEKILVIDDEESQRDISCRILETLGYHAESVSSGEEAVEYLKGSHMDLILLDMIMAPGIDGYETFKRIVKIDPNQKAIIVSGFAETDRVRGAQKLGAGQFLKKPLTIEKLGLAIKAELEK
jgi:PAS domain S-box-containing protein